MKLYNIYLLSISALLFAACSENEQADDTDFPAEELQLGGVQVNMASRETPDEAATRAISDFVVNTENDPTSIMDTRSTDWKLDVQIFNGSQAYQYGIATCTWNSTTSTWDPPQNTLYFPNYSRQSVKATLYPTGWNNTISLNQKTSDAILKQDILSQNGSNSITVNPAHIPTISMRHAHSMLNFILENVEIAQISEVNVHVGNDIYQPYKVENTGKIEYLVILPVGISNPEIRLTTVEGANYIVEVEIASTEVNTCYCIKLQGIELLLSSVTVTNWAYGEALAGQYSSVASYPTFRGPANTSVTLHYLNGLTQTITFNDRGESTPKPLGRTIIQIDPSTGDPIYPDPPLILNTMYVDLNPYL